MPNQQEQTAFQNVMFDKPLTLDLDERDRKIAATIKSAQEVRAKNEAMRNTDSETRREYNKLVSDHFNLKQWVRGCENRVNESAGVIRNIENRINAMIAEKNTTESPIGKRNLENAIVRLEGDLADEKSKHNRLRTENNNAIKQLKAFDVAKMEALKVALDAPKAISK